MANTLYQFRKASVLDVPFIFSLLQEGSFSGSFANFLMSRNGYFYTLKSLLPEVLSPLRWFKKTQESNLFIFTLNNEDIGFIKTSTPPNAGQARAIDLCAIVPEFRNQKHGTQMIRMYIDTLPSGTEVIAYCTKYSRAMQHILIKQKFRRNRKSFPLECYQLIKSTDFLPMHYAALDYAQSRPGMLLTPR